MPETRYIREYTEGKLTAEIPYEVSDDEIAEESEHKAMAKAEEMIDSITSIAQAKVFLKKLCKHLFNNGSLP